VRHAKHTHTYTFNIADLLERIDILEELMLAYYGPPRTAITADLVDYFLNLEEEEFKSDDSSDDFLPLHDNVSYSSDTYSDIGLQNVVIIVNDSDMENAKRLVDAFCQLFDNK